MKIIERWHLINTIFSQRNRFLYYGRRKITLTWHQVAGRDLDHFDKATAPQKQLFWQISLQKLFNKQGRAFLTWFRLTGDGVSLGLFFVLPGKWRFITRRYPWVAGKPNQISGAWIGVAQLLFFLKLGGFKFSWLCAEAFRPNSCRKNDTENEPFSFRKHTQIWFTFILIFVAFTLPLPSSTALILKSYTQ